MRVGKPHGLDGSFYVDGPVEEGVVVMIAGAEHEVLERKGTDARPIIRVAGVADRDAAEGLRGEPITFGSPQPTAAADEWLIADLVGCRVEGVGVVTGVLQGMSCDVLVVGEELVPLVRDAVTDVDIESKVIVVNRDFLGL